MIYNAMIKKIKLCECDCEGSMIIKFNNIEINTYFQIDASFYDVLRDKEEIEIDLWLVYGTPRRIEKEERFFPLNLDISGGVFKEKIVSILSDNEFRVDCGIFIDVDSEEPIKDDLQVGDFITISGTYQVFFPGTIYERE
jgi:hypothetical protein